MDFAVAETATSQNPAMWEKKKQVSPTMQTFICIQLISRLFHI